MSSQDEVLAALSTLRGRHARIEDDVRPGPSCRDCGGVWPCATGVIIQYVMERLHEEGAAEAAPSPS